MTPWAYRPTPVSDDARIGHFALGMTDKEYYLEHHDLVERAVAHAIKTVFSQRPPNPLRSVALHIAQYTAQKTSDVYDASNLDEAYLLEHKEKLERVVARAVRAVVSERAVDPLKRMGQYISESAEAQDVAGAPAPRPSLPEFDCPAPMLVMPLRQFQAQGRIVKSTKAWREEAMEKKWLIEYKEGSGKIAIYVSHMCAHTIACPLCISLDPLPPSAPSHLPTSLQCPPQHQRNTVIRRWWDRMFVEEGTDDIFRVGAPDYQADYPDEERKNKFAYYGGTSTYQRSRNLKWRIICEGVQRLIKRKALHEEDVTIWIDWQSSAPHHANLVSQTADLRLACCAPRRCLRPRPIAVSQDDTEQKEKQVRSLIRYATMSQFMLVPTEEEGGAGQDLDWRPQNIPGYGTRAWW